MRFAAIPLTLSVALLATPATPAQQSALVIDVNCEIIPDEVHHTNLPVTPLTEESEEFSIAECYIFPPIDPPHESGGPALPEGTVQCADLADNDDDGGTDWVDVLGILSGTPSSDMECSDGIAGTFVLDPDGEETSGGETDIIDMLTELLLGRCHSECSANCLHGTCRACCKVQEGFADCSCDLGLFPHCWCKPAPV